MTHLFLLTKTYVLLATSLATSYFTRLHVRRQADKLLLKAKFNFFIFYVKATLIVILGQNSIL